MMGETAQILSLWHRARAGGDQVCLATVVHVEGSSYRKPGARMLVTTAGERAGTISGGCLEAEVSRKAWWLTRNGPALEHYQSSFDEDGGGVPWGLGCGGTVWVLLEQEPLAVLAALEASVRNGTPSVIASCLSHAEITPAALHPILATPAATPPETHPATPPKTPQPGTAAVCSRPAAQPPSPTNAHSLPPPLRAAIEQAFAERRSLSLDANLAPTTTPPAYFVEYLAPPPHLTLYGAGDDAQPIAQFADTLGWRLTVADGRSHLLRPDRFPTSTELRLLHYDAASSPGPSPVLCGLDQADPANATATGTQPTLGLAPAATDLPVLTPPPKLVSPVNPETSPSMGLQFAVLLTHSYEQDRALLAKLLPQPLDYLGILGPRHRTRRLIAEVAPALNWTAEACFARLHSPVGLDLGAGDPAAIALAIVAELQATVSGREVAVRRPATVDPTPAPARAIP
jgi:xanthine dehydrogenase accessory factor